MRTTNYGKVTTTSVNIKKIIITPGHRISSDRNPKVSIGETINVGFLMCEFS